MNEKEAKELGKTIMAFRTALRDSNEGNNLSDPSKEQLTNTFLKGLMERVDHGIMQTPIMAPIIGSAGVGLDAVDIEIGGMGVSPRHE